MNSANGQRSTLFTSSPNQSYHAREQACPNGSRHHVLSRAWKFNVPIDASRLGNAYLEACSAHPMLRASFAPGGRICVIRAEPPAARTADDNSVLDIDFVQLKPIGGHVAELLIGRHAARLSVSHAVCDRRSFELAVAEISRAYAGHVLEPEGAPYADYATWLAAKRLATLRDRMLRERTAELQQAKWPPRSARHPSEPSAFSSAIRIGGCSDRLQAGCQRKGMTVMGALLEAAGTALSKVATDQPVIAGVPLALRPGARFQRTVGDYTNMGLVLLPSGRTALSSRMAMRELAAAVKFGAIHVLELSRLTGDHDAARVRIDVDSDERRALVLEHAAGTEVADRDTGTTRRDLAITLTNREKQPRLLCARRADTAEIDIDEIADQVAEHMMPYGF